MSISRKSRLALTTAAALLGAAIVGSPEFAGAVPNDNPAPIAAQPSSLAGAPAARAKKRVASKPTGTVKVVKKSKKKKFLRAKKKPVAPPPQKTTAADEFMAGYRVAFDLVYNKQQYEAGITTLRALNQDEHSDVATTIGYASRKLGRYDDAQHWYDKALAANPTNARTLSYYGMWHAEQGNNLKAADFLARVENACGNAQCREYAELKAVMSGTRAY